MKNYFKRFKSSLMEKTVISFVVEIIIMIGIWGFLLPFLFSAPSDIAVALGGLILFFTVVWFYFNIKYLISIIKSKLSEEDQSR